MERSNSDTPVNASTSWLKVLLGLAVALALAFPGQAFMTFTSGEKSQAASSEGQASTSWRHKASGTLLVLTDDLGLSKGPELKPQGKSSALPPYVAKSSCPTLASLYLESRTPSASNPVGQG